MKILKDIFGGDLRQFGMMFALVTLVAFFELGTGGLVLTSANVMNLLNGNAYILVLAIGMVLVIIAGHIDLSVGSVAAFAGIVVALALRDYQISPWLAVPLCLALGAFIGAWQGMWVAYVGVPGFVVTLAVHRPIEHDPGPAGDPVPWRWLPAGRRPRDRLQQPDAAAWRARHRLAAAGHAAREARDTPSRR